MRRCPICAKIFEDEAERLCPVHGIPLVEQRDLPRAQKGRLTGRVIEHRYVLGDLVGKGGMGEVYVGESLRIGRQVAVKVLHPELYADAKMRSRLFREVQAVSRIRHPNVVEIVDYGDDERAGSYLVMAYLHGESLASLVKREGRLPLAKAIGITVQLAQGLTATHGAGLIHRDLKPSNVRLLPNNRAMLLDFGLVKAFEHKSPLEFSTLTTGSFVFGTPWYMSPEQAALKPLGPRSDIYSLGVVLYEMLTGQPPFVDTNPIDVIEAQRRKPIPLPRHLDPPLELPMSLEIFLLRLLNKDQNRRPESMAEVVETLQRLAEEEGIVLTETSTAETGTWPVAQARDSRPSQSMIPHVETVQPVVMRFVQLAREQMDAMSSRIVDEIRTSLVRYQSIDRELAINDVRTVMLAAIRALEQGTKADLGGELERLTDQRIRMGFPVGEAIGAVLLGIVRFRPLIREAVCDDLTQFIEMQEIIDRLMIPFFMRLMDRYSTLVNTQLMQLNEQLVKRNEELDRLRCELSDQLRGALRQLAVLERFKSHLVDSVSSGILLVESQTRTVILCNKAVERMFGVGSDVIVGRSIDDALRLASGIPQEEFAEQIRLHGRVGLRKLRIRVHSGIERVVYIRGEQVDAQGGPNSGALLFVVDDVTEREHVVEAFSRYASPKIASRVLTAQQPEQPSSQRKEAALMVCDLKQLETHLNSMTEEELSDLFSDYVVMVDTAVSQHSGFVDWGVGGPLVAYFSEQGPDCCQAALGAVTELQRQQNEKATERQREGRSPFAVSAALHVGEVMVLNVGNTNRMLHTVIGEPVAVARAIQNASEANTVLLSASFRQRVGDSLPVAPGPTVQVSGSGKTVETHKRV